MSEPAGHPQGTPPPQAAPPTTAEDTDRPTDRNNK